MPASLLSADSLDRICRHGSVDERRKQRLCSELFIPANTDTGPAPTDVPTVTWSASLNSEGDLKLGGIENDRFFYNESEAANVLRFMIDSLCGTMPESENLTK